MLTIRAEIKSKELKSDGTYNVKIRFTLNRAVKRLSTSIFVTPQDMNKSFKLKNPKFIKQTEDLVRSYQDKCAKLQLEYVPRGGAQGPIDSIYVRDPDDNLIEISTLHK